MSSLWAQMRYLNPYEIHKLLINEYVLKKPGDTALLKRDTSSDKNDLDVIRQNHKFLWAEGDQADSWELQFAKKYYDKLFKEYCIGDLSLFKENKIALRWRTEREVVIGKGQFICGSKKCSEKDGLRTWEVNFAYLEHGIKRNALVKIRLCPECSTKLNYHSKKREVKRLKRSKYNSKIDNNDRNSGSDVKESSTSSSVYNNSDTNTSDNLNNRNEIDRKPKCKEVGANDEQSVWENHKLIEPKSRDEEMDDYLQDLLL